MFQVPVVRVLKCNLSKSLNLTIIRKIQSTTSSENVNEKCEHYDIIIAGGGMVGTTLACSLGKSSVLADKKILLLEGSSKFKGFECGEYSKRVSAISPFAVNLFKDIGAWDTIASMRYKPVKQIQVWDASSQAMITFNHDNFSDDVAYVVENDLILHAATEQLDKSKNVKVRYQARIKDVKLPGEGFSKSEVTLKDGEKIRCDLVVGADGINSLIRKRMNVEPFSLNYNQLGLVATLELSDTGDNSVAWQRFLPTGPLALLPLTDTLSSLVWTTTPVHANKLKSMPPNEFVDALNEAFYKEYPKDSLTTNVLNTVNSIFSFNSRSVRQYPPSVVGVREKSRACFPLGFGHAPSYVAQGAALIGDAAHRVHPLAGQGANLGFGDVKCLTDVLAEAVYSGFPLGDRAALLKYERERLLKNVPIMVGIHGLQRLYSTTFTPVVMLRSIGLQITHNIPPLKKIFMQQAMG